MLTIDSFDEKNVRLFQFQETFGYHFESIFMLVRYYVHKVNGYTGEDVKMLNIIVIN